MADDRFQPDWFSKPGDTLSALMANRGLTPMHLAERLGCESITVRRLLAGTTGIDQRLADGLSQTVGGTVRFWHNRQSAYEQSLARAAEAIPKEKVAAWLRHLPIGDMTSSGWIDKPTRRAEALKSCLAYFGVVGPEEWERRYAAFNDATAFRASPSFESHLGAVSAWLRQGEIEAAMIPCASWNHAALRDLIGDLRSLTKAKSLSYVLPRLRSACATVGVAAIFLRAPSGCRASGAARFISSNKAMIILSFRHLSDDHFWFSVFHEIGHLLLHGRSATFVDGEATSTDHKETEANAFAASVLIPASRQEELMRLRPRMDPIVRFAFSVGVSPGIVVGQMQHLGLIGREQLNFLKRRYDWAAIQAALS
jgi:plasmid maintenance system antidote protein VapI